MKHLYTFLFLITFCIPSIAQEKPHNPEYYYMKGETLRKKGKYYEAIDAYESAAMQDPKNHRYKYAIGKCYYSLKNYHSAANFFEKSIKLRDTFMPAYSNLAKSYQKDEKTELMVKTLQRAFEKDPVTKNKINYKNKIVNNLIERKYFHQALKHSREAVKIAPRNIEANYNNSFICNKLGHHEEAAKSAKLAIADLGSSDPKKVAKYFYELGFAYNKLEQYEKSKEAFSHAKYGKYKTLIAQLSPRFYCDAALVYLKIYRYKESKHQIHIALKMQNNSAEAHEILAKIAIEQSSIAQAINEYKLAIKNQENIRKKAELIKILIEYQMKAGQFNDVINSANQYLDIRPGNVNMNYLKAIAYSKTHQVDKGIKGIHNILNNPHLDNDTKAMLRLSLALMYKDINKQKEAEHYFKGAQYGTYKMVAQFELENLKVH